MKTGVMPLMQVFVSISDPRSPRHTQHDLAELLTVVVCQCSQLNANPLVNPRHSR